MGRSNKGNITGGSGSRGLCQQVGLGRDPQVRHSVVAIDEENMTTLTTMLSRDSTSVSSCLGGLCSNDSLYDLRHATEPVSQIMS